MKRIISLLLTMGLLLSLVSVSFADLTSTMDLPELSETYPGKKTNFGQKNGRIYAKMGPGSSYADAGAYPAGTSATRLTIYFCEDNWVFAEIFYKNGFDRYAYVPCQYVKNADLVTSFKSLDYFEGTTRETVTPLWGPDESYSVGENFSIAENTDLKVYFTENDYAYAEFKSGQELVRMWIPIEMISFENNDSLTEEENDADRNDVPTLSDIYPGKNASIISSDSRIYAKMGPGSNYADAGAYPANSKKVRLTIYFCENNWVFADIIYTNGFERYAYIRQSAVYDSATVPKAEPGYVSGKVNNAVTPMWGPDESFSAGENYRIGKNTKLEVYFTENDYAYAQFKSGEELVRMWIPIDAIDFD